jgi:hypothetical protein
MKLFSTIPIICVVTLVFAATVSAQTESWQSKPYTQWTKDEAKKVLNDSPWAQRIERTTDTPLTQSSNAGQFLSKAYTVRLRSALFVRQALLRLRQLEEKYDQMSDKKKAEFDEKNKPLVECPACADNYVVALLPPPSADARTTTLDKMKLFVHLVDERGRERQLVHFSPTKVTGQEIVFFFPRLDDKGEPLITPSSKKVSLTIDTSVIGMDAVVWHFDFDVSKMTFNGKIDF